MKRFISGLLIVLFLLAFMPLNAQMPEKKIEPVEEGKDATKYELKLNYTKGMVFEREITITMKQESNDPEQEKADGKGIITLGITVNEVKDGKPTDLKIEFKGVKSVGEMPEDQFDEEEMKKSVGHWVMIKKDENNKFKVYKKSDKFPESEEMLKGFDKATFFMFDSFELPKKAVAVGESFKFDYSGFMFDEGMSQGLNQMSEASDEKQDFKVKLEKVSEVDGAKIAYLKGEIKQESDFFGMSINMSIGVSIELDITNQRCLKSSFALSLNISGANPQTGEEIKMDVKMDIESANKFKKAAVEAKPEIAPKTDD